MKTHHHMPTTLSHHKRKGRVTVHGRGKPCGYPACWHDSALGRPHPEKGKLNPCPLTTHMITPPKTQPPANPPNLTRKCPGTIQSKNVAYHFQTSSPSDSTGSGISAFCAANSPSSRATQASANPSSPSTSPPASPPVGPCPMIHPAYREVSSSSTPRTESLKPSNPASMPPLVIPHMSVSSPLLKGAAPEQATSSHPPSPCQNTSTSWKQPS